MRKLIERCPACGGDMLVHSMGCNRCETEVHGRFSTTVFDRLTPDNLAFIEVFVRLRGNIKEMERELGIPYNAVRNRLDEAIRELGFDTESPKISPSPAQEDPRRKEILQRLERGEIDSQTAVAELENLKKPN
jgi:hypothetical protein